MSHEASDPASRGTASGRVARVNPLPSVPRFSSNGHVARAASSPRALPPLTDETPTDGDLLRRASILQLVMALHRTRWLRIEFPWEDDIPRCPHCDAQAQGVADVRWWCSGCKAKSTRYELERLVSENPDALDWLRYEFGRSS